MGSSCRKPRPLCCEICRLPQTKRGWVLKVGVYVCCPRMEHAHYCFKCRSNTKLANVEVRTSKNNRQVAVGSCTQCSGRVSRFMRRVLEEGARETSPPPQRPQVAHATGPAAGSSQAPAAPTAPKPPAAPRARKAAAPADDSAPTESQVPKRQRAPKKAASEPAIAVQM
eukprot:tig00020951_g16408.t1